MTTNYNPRRLQRRFAPGNLRYNVNNNEPGEQESDFVSTQHSEFTGSHNERNSPDLVLKGNLNHICDYGCCHNEKANSYIYTEALLKGLYSDVTIKTFGTSYKLHKLFLNRSGYFKTLFSWSLGNEYSTDNDDSDTDLESDTDPESDTQSQTHCLSEENQGKDDNQVVKSGNLKITKKLKKTKNQQIKRTWSSKRRSADIREIHFDDETITKEAFELAISRLYYKLNFIEEIKNTHSMIAIGQYLDMPEIVSHSVNHIINSLNMENLADHLEFATSNDYGEASGKIIEYSKGVLCSDGWQVGAEKWDNIPMEIIIDVVAQDYFFVPSEWDRCMFVIKLIERRLEVDSTPENVKPLKDLLNNKIHYVHFAPEKLFELESFFDINGENYIHPKVLHKALWKAMNLRSNILQNLDSNSTHMENEIISTFPPNKIDKWFKIPMQDETLTGFPSNLNKLLLMNLNSVKTTTAVTSGSDTNKTSTFSLSELSISSKEIELAQRQISQKSSWTRIPPFRFSIAFANVSDLLTEKRVYGKLIWYAGSYWNLYLQKNHVVSKSQNPSVSNGSYSSNNAFQIGVYLHRANNGSSLNSSKNGIINPDVFADNINYKDGPKKYPSKEHKNEADSREKEEDVDGLFSEKLSSSDMFQEKHDDFDLANNFIENFDDLKIGDGTNSSIRSSAPNFSLQGPQYSDNANSLWSSMSPHDVQPVSPITPYSASTTSHVRQKSEKSAIEYEDPRTTIPVYFIIFTPSRREKSKITSFLSVPNKFNRSQSWGWKSNSMCIFNDDGSFPPGHDPHLKFSIVLGNV